MSDRPNGCLASLKIGDVMTKDPITIDVEQSVSDARSLMYSRGIRHLPVMEGSSLFGVVSDRDIKLAAAVEIAGLPDQIRGYGYVKE